MQSTVEDQVKINRTDVAPHWTPVDNIAVPNDRVNELVEAGNPCPSHEKAGSSVPICDVNGIAQKRKPMNENTE